MWKPQLVKKSIANSLHSEGNSAQVVVIKKTPGIFLEEAQVLRTQVKGDWAMRKSCSSTFLQSSGKNRQKYAVMHNVLEAGKKLQKLKDDDASFSPFKTKSSSLKINMIWIINLGSALWSEV